MRTSVYIKSYNDLSADKQEAYLQKLLDEKSPVLAQITGAFELFSGKKQNIFRKLPQARRLCMIVSQSETFVVTGNHSFISRPLIEEKERREMEEYCRRDY